MARLTLSKCLFDPDAEAKGQVHTQENYFANLSLFVNISHNPRYHRQDF